MLSPVVLISIDTIRQDVFNDECFPRSWPIIDSDFARFPNALSHGVATPHAFPGIIAAHPVIGDGRFPEESTTIAELFERGKKVAFANNPHLRAERGYDRGFDHFDDMSPPTEVEEETVIDRLKQLEPVQNSRVLNKIYSWYLSLTSSPDLPYGTPRNEAGRVTDWTLTELKQREPKFIWSHYMDAHKPFIPETAVDGPDLDISKEKLADLNDYSHENDPPKEEYRELLWELYKANVRYVDQGLGRCLRELRELEWYDDALIIIVADHGELFGEHGCMWHPMTIDPVDELIDTPLAVKYPENRHAGDVLEHHVHHADILGTVASHTSTSKSTFDNTDTYQLLDSSDRITVSKSNTSIRVTGADGKVIRRRDGTRSESGTVTEEMRKTLDEATFPEVTTRAGNVRGIEDVQRMEQLKALGYR